MIAMIAMTAPSEMTSKPPWLLGFWALFFVIATQNNGYDWLCLAMTNLGGREKNPYIRVRGEVITIVEGGYFGAPAMSPPLTRI